MDLPPGIEGNSLFVFIEGVDDALSSSCLADAILAWNALRISSSLS